MEGYPGGSRLTGIPGPVYIEPYSSIRQEIWPHTMYPCSTRRLINPGTQENPSYQRELRIKQMREIALNMCIEYAFFRGVQDPMLCSSRMAFSNEANAELKTLNGKTQEVAKNEKRERAYKLL